MVWLRARAAPNTPAPKAWYRGVESSATPFSGIPTKLPHVETPLAQDEIGAPESGRVTPLEAPVVPPV